MKHKVNLKEGFKRILNPSFLYPKYEITV